MKLLFVLGRLRRSAVTLEDALTDFEEKLGVSSEDAVVCGDLAFWPISAQRHGHPFRVSPATFWGKHRQAFESDLLSEYVIGELGRNLLTSSQTEHVDEYDGRFFGYGVSDEKVDGAEITGCERTDQNEEQDWDGWNFSFSTLEPYAGRDFHTLGAEEWFERTIDKREETPSFGRKLLILIGRDRDKRFLESRMGQRLRAKFGQTARVVLNGQGADVAALAFETYATPSELFEQIKRLIPPRLIEDFLIADIGMDYSTGDQALSLFAEWDDQQRTRRASFPRKQAHEGARDVSNSALRTRDQQEPEQARSGWDNIRAAKMRWYPPPGWLSGAK